MKKNWLHIFLAALLLCLLMAASPSHGFGNGR